jgi:thymidylate synthase
MIQYLGLIDDVLKNGRRLEDPKGIGNISVLGRQLRFSMKDGFPLVTTRKLKFSWFAHELIWFLSGDTRIDYLNNNGVTFWDISGSKEQTSRFGREEGDLGPVYGAQWRHWKKHGGGEIDQINNLVEEIKTKKFSKRMLVTSWNPEDIQNVSIAPCHVMFKAYVAGDTLSLHIFQRAADVYIGVPNNIACYALLLHMLAQVTDLIPNELVYTMSDTHIYMINIDQAKIQLAREPKQLPTLELNKSIKDIFKFTIDDIKLSNYDPYPFIKSSVA